MTAICLSVRWCLMHMNNSPGWGEKAISSIPACCHQSSLSKLCPALHIIAPECVLHFSDFVVIYRAQVSISEDPFPSSRRVSQLDLGEPKEVVGMYYCAYVRLLLWLWQLLPHLASTLTTCSSTGPCLLACGTRRLCSWADWLTGWDICTSPPHLWLKLGAA